MHQVDADNKFYAIVPDLNLMCQEVLSIMLSIPSIELTISGNGGHSKSLFYDVLSILKVICKVVVDLNKIIHK